MKELNEAYPTSSIISKTKMKQRFTSLDVAVIAAELGRALPTLYLQNIYDLSSRIFLFKFARPGQRHQLLVDPGFRCHLTGFARTTPAEPSAFAARLRKLLKSRRVSVVHQIGADRVIEVVFGDDARYRLFLEFFSEGNVIVTDAEYRVLALQRRVAPSERQEELKVGATYEVRNRQGVGGGLDLSRDSVRVGIEKAAEKRVADAAKGRKSKKKAAAESALLKVLSTAFMQFSPVLLEHAARVKGFDLTMSLDEFGKDEAQLDGVMVVLEEGKAIFNKLSLGEASNGYIIGKPLKESSAANDAETGTEAETDKENSSLLYEDFHPFRPQQFEDSPNLRFREFDGFNRAVDDYFLSVESQQLAARLTDRETHAQRKLEAAKADHQRRIGGLQQVQELNVRKAQAIEGNVHRVQEAIRAVNGLVAQGMDWVEIARLIEMEQGRGNPVAGMVQLPLKLYENTITLLLSEDDDDEEEEDFEERGSESESDESTDGEGKAKPRKADQVKDKRLAVDIDLALSPWANAGDYYDQKKTTAVKQDKTVQSSSMALKSVEKKITADLKKGLQQEKQILLPVRKQLWFEKFYYFISSEGYLVVGGHDAQQSEILYQKYLSKGDAYVHAAMEGAFPFIVKNKPASNDQDIPPSTLSQAGNFCVASSVAWDSKAVMAAWWVRADQVSKTAPTTGEILQPGSFEIAGQRNYLPPAQLLLGFGVVFRVSKESKRRHTKYRVPVDDQTGDNANLEDDKAKETAMKNETRGQDLDTVTHPHEPADNQQSSAEANNQDLDSEEEEVPTKEENSDGEPGEAPDEVPDEATDDGPGEAMRSHDNVEHDDDYTNPLLSQGKDPHTQSPAPVRKDDQMLENENEEESEREDSGDDAAEGPQGSVATDDQAASQPDADAASIATGTTTQPTPQVRGKRGQRAKQKKKYAHQDEEDRALALRLLGSAPGQPKAPSQAEQQAARDIEQKQQRERKREQAARAQRSGKDAEEVRRKRMAEGTDAMDEEEKAELVLIEDFVGTPLPGDEILDILPVCAPWASLGPRLRWRVKIQPGTQKRGKALKEILGMWGRGIITREKKKMPDKDDERFEEEKGLRKEGELIKLIRDVEVVGVIPVKALRIVAGGDTTGVADKAKGGKGGGKGGGKSGRGGKGSKKAR